MPKVTIDGRTVEVEAGTNLIEAAKKVGVQIPHYCYHPRLQVVGQCRMCLVKVDGMPKLQAGCTTQVMKDGMEVQVDDPDVRAAQNGMMEFFLINHPLDCPICDQAGECGLQDYSFKHGQAFSRFRYEEKRTYPGRERIPLGPTVLLNMNRCIQCTRCIRFTEEISETGELGFFQRGARAEIGVFPGRELDNPLSTCVVDICPVGALTSTQFRFAERVWYLDKKPSVCAGCDAGCNITLEHRRGKIRRFKPRANPAVNDYWMCDHGRATATRYDEGERLTTPHERRGDERHPVDWSTALDRIATAIQDSAGDVVVLGSGHMTTEEAYVARRLADAIGTPHRSVWSEPGGGWHIPNPNGGVTGTEAAPNRLGAELAGLVPGPEGSSAQAVLQGDQAERRGCILVVDGDLGAATHDEATVARLRKARFLAVLGWEDSPLARAADIALPLATHAEKSGTFVNVQGRLQRFEQAFPPRGEARPGVEVLSSLRSRLDPNRAELDTPSAFARFAAEHPGLSGVDFDTISATGIVLEGPDGDPA